jgi:hypothetical protein
MPHLVPSSARPAIGGGDRRGGGIDCSARPLWPRTKGGAGSDRLPPRPVSTHQSNPRKGRGNLRADLGGLRGRSHIGDEALGVLRRISSSSGWASVRCMETSACDARVCPQMLQMPALLSPSSVSLSLIAHSLRHLSKVPAYPCLKTAPRVQTETNMLPGWAFARSGSL